MVLLAEDNLMRVHNEEIAASATLPRNDNGVALCPFLVIARERSGRGNLLTRTWHKTHC